MENFNLKKFLVENKLTSNSKIISEGDEQSPNTITVYPVEATGELGSAPSQYQQEWIPTNKYYNFMKENYEAR